MTTINKYLAHTVSVVHITHSRTGRTETGTDTGIVAFISNKTKIVKDPTGNQVAVETVVYMESDVDVSNSDELIVDGVQRPIVAIHKPRNSRSSEVQFIKVYLG